jgi:hypothetical protein
MEMQLSDCLSRGNILFEIETGSRDEALVLLVNRLD